MTTALPYDDLTLSPGGLNSSAGYSTANSGRNRTGWTAYQVMIYQTELYVLGFTFMIAFLGNTCVLVALGKKYKKRSRMHLFIMHLAIADLVAALFQVLPEWVIRAGRGFHSTDAACKFVKYFQVVSMYATTYVLLCAAFDRYMAIRHPMQSFKNSTRKLYLHIALSWLLSLLMAVPQLFLFEKPGNKSVCKMRREIQLPFIQGYVTWYFVFLMVIPAVLLSYFYGKIARVIITNIHAQKIASRDTVHLVDRRRRVTESFAPRASSTTMISRAKMKTVKMTLVVVLTYVACWAPFFTVQMLGVWGAIDPNNLVSSVLHLLACLNSCTNPWIYMAFSGRLTTEVKSCVGCKNEFCVGNLEKQGSSRRSGRKEGNTSQTNANCTTFVASNSESFNRYNQLRPESLSAKTPEVGRKQSCDEPKE